MIGTKQARRVLTRKEQRHLTESNIHSLAAMKRQARNMVEARERAGGSPSAYCTECWFIARKLGLIDPERTTQAPIVLEIVSERLTDGSVVWSVVMKERNMDRDLAQLTEFPCRDLPHAGSILERLKEIASETVGSPAIIDRSCEG